MKAFIVIGCTLVVLGILARPRITAAGAIGVTNFTELTDASFIDVAPTNSLSPITFDSIVITPDHLLVSGSFADWPTGTADDPADGDGYIATPVGTGIPVSSITLNFSSPLAAFGVTFRHFPPDRVGNNQEPGLLQVFDGPNGSGNLLGSISSSGLLTSDPGGSLDFVAVWSDALDIRSAILTGTGLNGGFAVDGYAVSLTPFSIEVAIDIKPGSFPNSINPKSKGVIPVAILTTDNFDATTVDPLSIEFGPDGAVEAHGRGHIEDANKDGRLDLVLHFNTQETGIQCGDTSASLTGQTFSGQEIEGSDAIITAGCK